MPLGTRAGFQPLLRQIDPHWPDGDEGVPVAIDDTELLIENAPPLICEAVVLVPAVLSVRKPVPDDIRSLLGVDRCRKDNDLLEPSIGNRWGAHFAEGSEESKLTRALDQDMGRHRSAIIVLCCGSTAERYLHDAQQMIKSCACDIDQKVVQLTAIPITVLEGLTL